jgi:hypothetical protein
MGKTRTKKELEIIKNCLEYELIETIESKIDEYSIDILSDIKEEDEIEMMTEKCENLYENDLQCLFDILITNHFDYLIDKYDLVVENDEVDFELITPIYTDFMTKYLDHKLYEIEDSKIHNEYSKFITTDLAEYYSEIRDSKLSLIGIED